MAHGMDEATSFVLPSYWTGSQLGVWPTVGIPSHRIWGIAVLMDMAICGEGRWGCEWGLYNTALAHPAAAWPTLICMTSTKASIHTTSSHFPHPSPPDWLHLGDHHHPIPWARSSLQRAPMFDTPMYTMGWVFKKLYSSFRYQNNG